MCTSLPWEAYLWSAATCKPQNVRAVVGGTVAWQMESYSQRTNQFSQGGKTHGYGARLSKAVSSSGVPSTQIRPWSPELTIDGIDVNLMLVRWRVLVERSKTLSLCSAPHENKGRLGNSQGTASLLLTTHHNVNVLASRVSIVTSHSYHAVACVVTPERERAWF